MMKHINKLFKMGTYRPVFTRGMNTSRVYHFSEKKEHSISAALREKIGPIKTYNTVIGEQELQLQQTN